MTEAACLAYSAHPMIVILVAMRHITLSLWCVLTLEVRSFKQSKRVCRSPPTSKLGKLSQRARKYRTSVSRRPGVQ